MKHPYILLTMLLCLHAGAVKKPRAIDPGILYLDTHYSLYDSLQKRIFQFAEPAYQEFRSVAQWTSFLESQGFAIEKGAAGIPTAFVATY
ncbi:MAG: amidohydrolase, partial [Bacteroidales bacterium]|nr:amidohydrolase [Bacteroidales bacterium]